MKSDREELIELAENVVVRLAEHGVAARRALAAPSPALIAEVDARGAALERECRRLADLMDRRGYGDLSRDLRLIAARRPKVPANG
jgi:hypothetical protein